MQLSNPSSPQSSLQFGGLYLNQVNVKPIGVGAHNIRVEVGLTNDNNGNHLDKYGAIAGNLRHGDDEPDHYDLEGEKVFVYGQQDSFCHFYAGRKPLDKNDANQRALVFSLMDELTMLNAKVKASMATYADRYFSAE